MDKLYRNKDLVTQLSDELMSNYCSANKSEFFAELFEFILDKYYYKRSTDKDTLEDANGLFESISNDFYELIHSWE